MDNTGEKQYKTGLLMGVFDLFHVGHLRLIRRAKERCSFLRVAVLSDELVIGTNGDHGGDPGGGRGRSHSGRSLPAAGMGPPAL